MNNFMPLDAAILILWSLSSLVIAQEDGSVNRLTRLPYLAFFLVTFGYSLWLLSSWEPSPRGYPWQRIVLDGIGATIFMIRAAIVLYALKCNSGRLFALKPFGMS